jgi:hypothetical protein
VNIYEAFMGGSGSGRIGWRRKVGSCLSLDVRELARKGALRPGAGYRWQWTYNGEPWGAIETRAAREYSDEQRPAFGAPPWIAGLADHVRLIYNARGESFDYPVWLQRTGCHYGGIASGGFALGAIPVAVCCTGWPVTGALVAGAACAWPTPAKLKAPLIAVAKGAQARGAR